MLKRQVLSIKKGRLSLSLVSQARVLSRPSASAAKKRKSSGGLALTPIDNPRRNSRNRKQTSFPPLERILRPNSSKPVRCSSHYKLMFTVSLHFNNLPFSGWFRNKFTCCLFYFILLLTYLTLPTSPNVIGKIYISINLYIIKAIYSSM